MARRVGIAIALKISASISSSATSIFPVRVQSLSALSLALHLSPASLESCFNVSSRTLTSVRVIIISITARTSARWQEAWKFLFPAIHAYLHAPKLPVFHLENRYTILFADITFHVTVLPLHAIKVSLIFPQEGLFIYLFFIFGQAIALTYFF
jgi:hypothetical protein